MKNLKEKLDLFITKLNLFSDYLIELVFTFIFKDILYVLLPLTVIAFTYILFKQFNLISFFSSSNLAFAVTVLNSITLSSFIELKVKHQNSKSFALFEGAKLYILLLVLSTLTLSFIIMNEINVLAINVDRKTLCWLNVVLLAVSASSLFLKNMVLLRSKYFTTTEINADQVIGQVKSVLVGIGIDINNLLHIIKNTDQDNLKNISLNSKSLDIYSKHEFERINILIKQNKEKIDLLEIELDKMSQIKHTN